MFQIKFPMEEIVMIAAGITITVTPVTSVTSMTSVTSVKAAIISSMETILVVIKTSAVQKEVEQAPSEKEEAAQVEAQSQEALDREAQIRTQSSSATKRHTMRMKRTRFFSMRLVARVTYLTSLWKTMELTKTS